MHERLKSIRKTSGLTQEAFATHLGASRGMIAKYETGLVVPDQTMRMLICQKFNVNPAWLETGEGKPYKEGIIPDLVRILRQYPALQSALEGLLDVMGPEEWAMLNKVVAKAIAANKKGAEE